MGRQKIYSEKLLCALSVEIGLDFTHTTVCPRRLANFYIASCIKMDKTVHLGYTVVDLIFLGKIIVPVGLS